MKNILTTFKEIARLEGITISKLEAQIGASKGVLSRALREGTDIQAKWLLSLAEKYPQYNAEWMLTGAGSVVRTESDPLQLMEESGSLSNQKQLHALLQANNALKEANEALKETKEILKLRIIELEERLKQAQNR
tara:strand:+ start:50453 stop:50857 length:405 start_codon:yes stop_codon:yes gene_type:complete